MLKNLIGIFVGFCFCSTQVIAETKVEEAKRLEKLTIAAIDCAVLSDDGKGRGITDAEGKRLADVAFTAGRRFLDLVAKFNADEIKRMVPDGKIAWASVGGVSGPSIDFVLGRMWQARQDILFSLSYKVGGSDAEWVEKRASLYNERNCELIR